MGKINLCIFLLLIPMGGAFGGTEGVVSGAQPKETPSDTARILDHPVMVTVLDQAPSPEKKETVPIHGDMAMPAATTAISAEPTDDLSLIVDVAIFVSLGLIIGSWYCYNMISPLVRSYPVRSRLFYMPIDGASDDEEEEEEEEGVDAVPSLSSDQAEAPEDIPPTSSYQAEVPEEVPLVCRVQPEAPEDAPKVQGMF